MEFFQKPNWSRPRKHLVPHAFLLRFCGVEEQLIFFSADKVSHDMAPKCALHDKKKLGRRTADDLISSEEYKAYLYHSGMRLGEVLGLAVGGLCSKRA